MLQRAPKWLRERGGMISSVGSSLAVFGLQAFHAILLARLLGPTGRGEYATAMFYTQTMLYIGLAGSSYSIARRAMQPGTDSPSLQRSAARVGIATGTISMLIAIGLSLVGVPSDKSHLIPLCIVCTLMLPIEHLRLTALAVDHGRGKFTRYNLSRVFAAAVFPAIVIVLYWRQIDSLTLIAWLTVLVPLVGYVFYFALSDNKQLLGRASPAPSRLIREGAGDGAAVLASDLFDRLGNVLLLWLVAVHEYGLYVTAVPAATLLLVGPHTFALYSFRSGSSETPLSRSALAKYALLVVGFQLLALGSMLVVLEPLLLFLFGEEFKGIFPVARILLFAMTANGCALVGDGYLRGCGKGSHGVWTRAVAAVAMLLSLSMLPDGSQLHRVAIAMSIGYAVNALLTGWLCFRQTAHALDKQSEVSEDGITR
ncbi:MAG: membrane protein [Aureliella sp.]